jgi:hypothetical protein
LVWRAAAPPTPRAIPGARNDGRVIISGAWYNHAIFGKFLRVGILQNEAEAAELQNRNLLLLERQFDAARLATALGQPEA